MADVCWVCIWSGPGGTVLVRHLVRSRFFWEDKVPIEQIEDIGVDELADVFAELGPGRPGTTGKELVEQELADAGDPDEIAVRGGVEVVANGDRSGLSRGANHQAVGERPRDAAQRRTKDLGHGLTGTRGEW